MREPFTTRGLHPEAPLRQAMGLEGCSLPACASPSLERFFIWIASNPLKSPESDEGIQENPSPFSWCGLVWLGFGLEEFGLRRSARGPRPVAPGVGHVEHRPSTDLVR